MKDIVYCIYETYILHYSHHQDISNSKYYKKTKQKKKSYSNFINQVIL